MNDIKVRDVKVEDAARLLEIYAPYVVDTAISFEYEVPSKEEFEVRIKSISASYPYIVAEVDGVIVGYAYAGVFKARKAYDHCVETTIYVDKDKHGCGVGRALYKALEDELAKRGKKNLNACIGWTPRSDDKHLTNQSEAFHEHMGYQKVAHFHKCGYKFDEWYDMIWMEKILG